MLNQSEYILIQDNAMNMLSIYMLISLLLIIKVIEYFVLVHCNQKKIQELKKYKEELLAKKRQFLKQKNKRGNII